MNQIKRLLFLLFCVLSPGIFAQDTIRITNGEWEPFLSEFAPHYGINSHIISEAFSLEGIKVEWGFFPWKRSYQLAKQGKQWDASATWWPAEETKEAFLIGEAVSQTSFVFFHMKGVDFDWTNFDDLKHLKIGGTLEYDYGQEFTAFLNRYNKNLDWGISDEQGFKKLLRGRFDIFPNDPIVGYHQINNTFSKDDAARFTHHPKEFEQSTLHLIISKKSPHAQFFLERFNSGYNKLKASGKLNQMLSDYKKGKYDKQLRSNR